MKNLKTYILLAGVLFTTFSCDKDDLDSKSIFNTDVPTQNEFDQWIRKNLTDPYNITIDYTYKDHETDLSQNVVPASLEKSIALAKLVKEVWMNPYTEVAGTDFLKKNCFRQFTFIGSGEYDSQGTIKLGTAEGGIKVTLFRVNDLDLDNIYINGEDFYREHYKTPLDLNYWYFHTMHHEFCHILTQKKEYSTDFRTISQGKYKGPDWINVDDDEAAEKGFVTGYATGEYNEDFAETYAVYVTSTDAMWNQILEKATKQLVDTNGAPVYEVDKLGNPIVATDKYGDPVYETDEKGNKIQETDRDGNAVYKLDYERDEYGFVPVVTDAEGNTVYATDEEGKPVYLTDSKGNKIPVYNEQLKYGTFYDVDDKGNVSAYFVYSSNFYNVTQKKANFTYAVETTEKGDTIRDESGNPVIKYYKMPVFKDKTYLPVYKYKYVQMTDETAKKTILAKLEIIRTYFREKWGINIDELRKKVLEKTSAESLKSINLKSLKD